MSAVLAEFPSCPPRYATARTARRTLGPAIGKVAARLGTPFMPWQQHVVDVAFEVDESSNLVYREVVLTVPRQSGKTTLLLAVMVHRALARSQFGPRNKMIYTAQTRKDAREKLEEDFVIGGLDLAPTMRGKYRFVKTNGREHVRFLESGSKIGIDTTTEKSGHGGTLDLGVIDEAFAQIDGRVEQAFSPAMITRPQAQQWVNSTAGWLGGSPYLWSKVAAGRAAVESGEASSSAYFEWSADPDADPEDPATWWACMPALGQRTITESAIRSELVKMKASPEGINGFKRAYLNLWVPKDAPAEQVIPHARWLASRDRMTQADPRVFSFDATPDRSWGTIATAGGTADSTHVEVVEHREGMDWMVDRICDLDDEYEPVEWLVDKASPAASLVPALVARRFTVVAKGAKPTRRSIRVTELADMLVACGNFYDGTTKAEPSVFHVGQPELDAALGAAKKRIVGDRFAWDRKDLLIPISPLVAVTLAAHGLATARQPAQSLPPQADRSAPLYDPTNVMHVGF